MQKRNNIFIQIIALSAVLLCGCSAQENSNFQGLGFAKFAISIGSTEFVQPDQVFALRIESEDGKYSCTWENINDYQQHETLYVGSYKATVWSGIPGSEGYDCPSFAGEAPFDVPEGNIVSVDIPCDLQQAVIYPSVEDLSDQYEIVGLTLHSLGNNYLNVNLDADAPLFVLPGKTNVYVTMVDSEGRQTTLASNLGLETVNAKRYELDVKISEGKLLTECNGSKSQIALTPELFEESAPQITAKGFVPGIPLVLTEGFPSIEPVTMDVQASADIAALMLTTQGFDLSHQCNLLDMPSEFIEKGLKVECGGTMANIDFTGLLEHLNVDITSDITFTLQAYDACGRVSMPCALHVQIESIDFVCASHTSALVGVNETTIKLEVNSDKFEEHDFSVYVADPLTGEFHQTEILDARANAEAQTIDLSFNVGEGIDVAKVRIDFLNVPKLYVDIMREVPKYDIAIDAYATRAMIEVQSTNEQIAAAVTKFARVYVGDVEYNVIERNLDDCTLMITGLRPSSKYQCSMVVIAGRYAPTANFSTEADLVVPDGDFEDANPSIQYQHLASGGIYSNSSFPIYSMQNFVDIDIWWPQKHWANVNAKTFCNQATNQNTWYMQPSAQCDYEVHSSGLKSVRLTSVGWSFNGEDIPPYSQQEGMHHNYNANIPMSEHRSAGKLFLGTYRFDPSTMTEKYYEGISFGSRPTSLNGYYKFTPDVYDSNDRGTVYIELLGKRDALDVVIATGFMEFVPVTDMKTFNVPLEYMYDNIKAEQLKIMFSSSKNSGNIEHEDAEVKVTAYPETAVWRGSELWIDNLSFSY